MTGRSDDEDLTSAISRFLDRHWDVIGVNTPGWDAPEAGTEYAPYAAHLLTMLQRGESAPAMSHYLMEQATRAMGVGPGPTRKVAVSLHAWWAAGHVLPLEDSALPEHHR